MIYDNDDVKQNIKIVLIEPYAAKWRRYQRSGHKSSFEKCGENTDKQLDVTTVPKEIYVQKWLNYHTEKQSKSIDEANDIISSKRLHE